VAPADLTPVVTDDYQPVVDLAIQCADSVGGGLMLEEFAAVLEKRDKDHALRGLGRRALPDLLLEILSGERHLVPGIGYLHCSEAGVEIRPFEMNGGDPWES
jgi:hypothetical protein